MKKGILIILDGFGEGKPDPSVNAIAAAQMPFYRSLREKYPTTFLRADGNHVGLPEGAMGGSEVGHLTIGAGRIVWQPLEEITRNFESGEFVRKPEFREWVKMAKAGKNIHLIGMLSDGGVHSHLRHLFALLEVLKKEGVTENVYLHIIADGRDVPPRSIWNYLELLLEQMQKTGVGKLASLIGRYYAMDRDKNWDRTKVAYELLTTRKGSKIELNTNFEQYLYGAAENDYYLPPYNFTEFPAVDAESLVIFWNFRSDRSEQLTRFFTDPKCAEAPRKFLMPSNQFLAFGPYTIGNAVDLFTPQKIHNGMGEWLAQKNFRQLRLAETEKFAHVTFFFNGQEKTPWPGEERILIPSPKCPSYDAAPHMSAEGITDTVLQKLPTREFDFILCNFANPDLVGHSGVFSAVVEGLEFLDTCLARMIPVALENDYEIILTADHGNAEEMKYPDGSAKVSHTLNPVPCTILSSRKQMKLQESGGMKDISPTMLDLMEIPKPEEMTGESLIL